MWKWLKKLVKSLPFALTKNQQYDRQSRFIIRKVLRREGCAIDIGCHKGEVMDIMLQSAPEGRHFGFEPIPFLYQQLVKKYAARTNVVISDLALSDRSGTSSFNYVVSNPSYSGLIRRQYDKPGEIDTSIAVKTARLDDVLPDSIPVDLIKIDVEGGEYLVLAGAEKLIRRCRPVIIFEHGLGASEYYGASPEQLFDLLHGYGLRISLLTDFLRARPSMDRVGFANQYYQKRNYYFVAHP